MNRSTRNIFRAMLRRNEPLTNEEINQYAPSAFASEPWFENSAKYVFLPTSNVIEAMREAGFLPYSAQQSNSRIPGKRFFTKHMLRFRVAGQNPTQLGDSVLETILVNGHDRSTRWKLFLGAFRFACLNGLFVAESLVESVSIMHTGNALESVVSATRALIAKAPIVAETINLWKSIDLNPAEARFLAEGAHALRFDGDSNAPDVDRLLAPRRSEDSRTDLWSTFNRVQENVIQGGLRVNTPSRIDETTGRFVASRRTRTRPVDSIDANSKLNQQLWALAEKMASLKGGKL